MLEWNTVKAFKDPEHYIEIERSICEAIWTGQAEMYFEPEFSRPALKCCLLPYHQLYLVDQSTFSVWCLIQPTEKGGGSFRMLGVSKRKHGSDFPIHPRKSNFKLHTFIDLIDECDAQ
jgi:hypothetical protein